MVSLDDILDKYKSVFAKEIGIITGHTADIVLEEDTQLIFHRARSVPYALTEKVEEELKRLEDNEVIIKIDNCEWAAPIVVPKSNNEEGICGDFKVAINKVVKADPYLLPLVNDLFAKLSSGRVFSKIDLSNEYLQMGLSESSKPYLTVNTHKGLYMYNRLWC